MDTLDLGNTGQNPEVWEKAIAKLRSRLMPPAGAPQPAQADVDHVVDYLEASVDCGRQGLACRSRADPATQPRRVRRFREGPRRSGRGSEADSAHRDRSRRLQQYRWRAGDFASFMEQYLSAARRVAQRAIGDPVPKMAKVFYRGGGGGGGQAGPGLPQSGHPQGRVPTRDARWRELYACLPG